ncbi:MAG TPA: ACP S-malonyltransferase [Candidatus Acetothermia bacterium]|nr:ACP S-malonyltransferase [Candidatus Acetothermia bacterium]
MKSKIAFLFPGQGTVPSSLPPTGERSVRLLDLAEQAGIPISSLLQDGKHNRLVQTEFAQPTIFVDSISKDEALRSRGIIPVVVAGHSLGEYAALASSGVISPEDALQVVITRGRLMSHVSGGGMAAILKLSHETVAEICRETGETVNVANINGPTQIVISGDERTLRRAMNACQEAGGRVIRLDVSGPFHSPLLAPAQAELAPLINAIQFRTPRTLFVSSVSGRLEEDVEAIKSLLLTQITACVQWVSTVESLVRLEIEVAIEVGPGKVLTNLGRRITGKIEFITFEEALDGAV